MSKRIGDTTWGEAADAGLVIAFVIGLFQMAILFTRIAILIAIWIFLHLKNLAMFVAEENRLRKEARQAATTKV
jgi:uncharacterized membrane protein